MKNTVFREPCIVDLHHHVLLPWADLRRTLPMAPRVITLDFHTDTLSAVFSRGVAAEPGDWQDAETVQNAVDQLHHDEHFDWALRTGLISRADIIAISPQVGIYPHPAMLVHPLAPELTPDSVLQSPENIRHPADHALDLLPEIPMETPYILDVDCDFFLTAQSLRIQPDSRFSAWVQNAAMITLSRENDWVKLLRLPGENITGDAIARSLLEQCAFFR